MAALILDVKAAESDRSMSSAISSIITPRLLIWSPSGAWHVQLSCRAEVDALLACSRAWEGFQAAGHSPPPKGIDTSGPSGRKERERVPLGCALCDEDCRDHARGQRHCAVGADGIDRGRRVGIDLQYAGSRALDDDQRAGGGGGRQLDANGAIGAGNDSEASRELGSGGKVGPRRRNVCIDRNE